MKLTILGCGTSSGVPRIGNDWGSCDPKEPKNSRSRASIIVETETTRILVDTSPDLREQLLINKIDAIDAVVWTHDHADHCHGIDDLRQLYHRTRRPVSGFARAKTLESLQTRFSYVFKGNSGYPATCVTAPLLDKMRIGDIEIETVDQPHGPITSAGLKFISCNKSICYATDFSKCTDKMLDLYKHCDIMVIDALREEPHPTHSHLEMSLEALQRIEPAKAVLTHMDKSMDYRSLQAMLPLDVNPAFDTMTLEI